jgi:protein-S-isoprenylcysteine O-methyltransferase Ste14
MTALSWKAFGGLLWLLIALATSLFVPAWTSGYWQAWVFLVVFSASALAITAYLLRKDPKLLERRVRGGPFAEKEMGQKITQFVASIVFVAVFVLSALDHRFHWSTVAPRVVLTGDALVAVGLLVVFLVFRENTFASATIAVDADQKVVSTGPYALVRHPMYVGGIIMLVGTPLALGSLWGLFAIVPITLAIVWRLLDEERFLAKNLPGYAEYRETVRYRLVPFLW